MHDPAAVKSRPKNAKRTASSFRLDIEGLRAIAVLSVLAYHLSSQWLPGGFVGVDIFFVISGFLITSHLIREWERNGRISLSSFYARRMIRLLPAATLALIGTLVATVLFVPQYLWRQIGADAAGAAAYIVNWMFAARSVDYLAEDTSPSPVQHFWSLAVEEQYYLIWPLLIILAAVIAKRRGTRTRRALLITAAAVILVSFAAALFAAAAGDATAYFSTVTRLWELAIGAATAITLPTIQRLLSERMATIGHLLGVLMIALSLFVIDGNDVWPGPLTALPVLGSALAIACGERAGLLGTALSWRPLVWIGGISYSLYLWHWPIIIIAGYVLDTGKFITQIAIVVASVTAAAVSVKLFENPIRFSKWARARPRNGLLLGVSLGTFSIAIALIIAMLASSNSLKAPEGARPDGAGILGAKLQDVTAHELEEQPEWVLPAPHDAEDDVPELYADDCQQDQNSSEVLACDYGDINAHRLIAVVGDSKANQWLPALDSIATSSGYKVTVMTKSACSFSDAPAEVSGNAYPSCDDWNKNVDRALEELRPEIIITSMVNAYAHVPGSKDDASSAMARGLTTKLERVSRLSGHTVVVGDTPHPPRPEYQCVAEHADAVDECSFELDDSQSESALDVQRQAVLATNGSVVDAGDLEDAELSSKTTVLVDMTDAICPEVSAGQCPAVIGNAMVYRQGSHLTATYVQTLAPVLSNALAHAGLELR